MYAGVGATILVAVLAEGLPVTHAQDQIDGKWLDFVAPYHEYLERAFGWGFHYIPRILAADICHDRTHAVPWANVSLVSVPTGEVLLDADWEFTRPAADFSELKIDVNRCSQIGPITNCEYFTTLKWGSEVCHVVTREGMPLSKFFGRIEPAFKCPNPVHAGLYSARDATIDMDMISKLPIMLEGAVYRLLFELFDENRELHFCFKIAVEFVKVPNA